MLKINLVVLLALFVTACNPIPQLLAQHLTRCSTGSLVMLPGQSAEGWVSDELPNYVDIVGASSELDGETLTAVFHLRGIPQRLEFNRKGVPDNRIEYMWVVAINTDGDPQSYAQPIRLLATGFLCRHPVYRKLARHNARCQCRSSGGCVEIQPQFR